MKKTNVSRYARMFEILCTILIPVVLLIAPLLWFFGDNLTDSTYGLHIASFSFQQRLFFVCLDTVGVMLIVYCLVLLIRIARNFRRNEIFTGTNVNMFLRLRSIAGIGALYNVLYMALFPLFITTTFPVYLLISSVISTGLVYGFVYIFLSLLATLIVKATELQGDQDLTV